MLKYTTKFTAILLICTSGLISEITILDIFVIVKNLFRYPKKISDIQNN